jgi:hypothetical protein
MFWFCPSCKVAGEELGRALVRQLGGGLVVMLAAHARERVVDAGIAVEGV